MKQIFTTILMCIVFACNAMSQNIVPKREFRGAWIQMINGQFMGMSRAEMQANLTHQLDVLEQCGINAIMFQVRGEADAMYASPYEPWSRFLTGKQGTPPNPYWDPLEWMINECHKRGMELHAWINPFRAKTKTTKELSITHPYVKHPERFFEYDGLYLFDPGMDINRSYICKIAADIVRRYDVDGIHMDDYFYPYPVAGVAIPDQFTYETHKNGINNINDWRRYNVNLFVEAIHDSIRAVKPWVKFGISPFGIYHNAKPGSNIPGSQTNGTQNYDDLYADVLYWISKGWVDYSIPQLYWEIGHRAADYDELIKWWSRFAGARPLFIGQDVERTVRASDPKHPGRNQMDEKIRLQRSLRGIQGSCLWYSAAVVRNEGNYATALQKVYNKTKALQPFYPFIDDKAPSKPRKLKTQWMPNGFHLFWLPPKAKDEMNEAHNYVVYRFKKGKKINLFDPTNIVAITPNTFVKLPYASGKDKYVYVVTSLDRLQNESKPAKVKVKL